MIEWSVDPAYAEGAAAARFASLDDTFAVGGEQITSDKVSEVLRVTIDATRYYVKRYRRRGFALRNALGPSRIESEWKNLQRFTDWGIPTAAVVASGQERRLGLFARGAMVTEEIAGGSFNSILSINSNNFNKISPPGKPIKGKLNQEIK